MLKSDKGLFLSDEENYLLAMQNEYLKRLTNYAKVEIKEDEEIYEVEGVKMIPLRTVAEALGFEVVWDAEGQSINLVKETFSSMIRIGDVEGGINRARLVLEVAPQLPADKTYVPVSYINAVLEALSL